MRWTLRLALVWVGVFIFIGEGRAESTLRSQPEPGSEARSHPDLGGLRFRDPLRPRELWFGFDLGGLYLPASVSPTSTPVYLTRGTASWAFALAPWMSLGGRHDIALYEAETARLRIHTHELDFAFSPAWKRLRGTRHRDRLTLEVESHDLAKLKVQREDGSWEGFALGGVRDFILGVSYGFEHRFHSKWRLGWSLAGRYAWVFEDSQRMARAALRVSFYPRPAHRLALEVVGFGVHRDPSQFGASDFDRFSLHGQVAGEYGWMSASGIGLVLRARLLSAFMSGEAPVYELRNESLRTPFGELSVGLRVRW